MVPYLLMHKIRMSYIIKTYIIYFCTFSVESYCNPTSTTCLTTGFGSSSLKAGNMMYSNHCSDTAQPSRRQSTVGTGMCINT